MSRACSLAGCPLQERVQLDAILTVVDAKHVLQHQDDTQIEEGAENEVGGACSASAAQAACSARGRHLSAAAEEVAAVQPCPPLVSSVCTCSPS